MSSPRGRITALAASVLWTVACTANRAVVTAPEPQSVGAYLTTNHPADILVTDNRGASQWYHNPRLDGDSLRGVRGHDLPQLPVSIAVSQIAGIQEPHFSTGKTLGLLGGVVATAAVALLILGSMIGTHVAY